MARKAGHLKETKADQMVRITPALEATELMDQKIFFSPGIGLLPPAAKRPIVTMKMADLATFIRHEEELSGTYEKRRRE